MIKSLKLFLGNMRTASCGLKNGPSDLLLVLHLNPASLIVWEHIISSEIGFLHIWKDHRCWKTNTEFTETISRLLWTVKGRRVGTHLSQLAWDKAVTCFCCQIQNDHILF